MLTIGAYVLLKANDLPDSHDLPESYDLAGAYNRLLYRTTSKSVIFTSSAALNAIRKKDLNFAGTER